MTLLSEIQQPPAIWRQELALRERPWLRSSQTELRPLSAAGKAKAKAPLWGNRTMRAVLSTRRNGGYEERVLDAVSFVRWEDLDGGKTKSAREEGGKKKISKWMTDTFRGL